MQDGSVEAVLPPILAAPPAAGPSPRLRASKLLDLGARYGYSHFSSPGAAFNPAYHYGYSRHASANLYAVHGRRLGVRSAEDLLNAVLEIHFATYKTALRPRGTSGSFNVFASLDSQFLTACSSSSTTASRSINAASRLHRVPEPQRTPQRPPPTPCKPCRTGRINPNLPNRTLPRTRRIVKTTSRQAANGALKPSYKGYRSKRQDYTVGVLPRNTISIEVLLPLIISIYFY